MIYPDEFETDLLILAPEPKRIRPDKAAERYLQRWQAFMVGVTTLLSCAIFAAILAILPG